MNKIKFILHRPRNPKNIGAAARGMANFGFRELVVVDPYAKAWRETRSAVRAEDVVKKAKKRDSLKQALRGTHLVVGTSTGSRRRKDDDRWIPWEKFPERVNDAVRSGQKIAVVFGSEKSGLSNEDLEFCHAIVTIPTVPDCPSMNLAQAVAVAAYALRSLTAAPPAAEKSPTVTSEDVERLVARALSAFTGAGLLKGWDMKRAEGRIRKAFYRWNMTDVDVAMLHGLFRWVVKNA